MLDLCYTPSIRSHNVAESEHNFICARVAHTLFTRMSGSDPLIHGVSLKDEVFSISLFGE